MDLADIDEEDERAGEVANYLNSEPAETRTLSNPMNLTSDDELAEEVAEHLNGDDDPKGTISMDLPATKDLLERDTASGGTTQAARRDYVYNPSTKEFDREFESNQFGPDSNNLELFGGTSDEFEYNRSASQTPANERNLKAGETFEVVSEFTGPVEKDFKKGDDQLGASGELTVGRSREVSLGVSVDRNGVEITAGGEFALGAEGKVEAHAGIGPLNGAVSAGAKAGVSGSGEIGLFLDPRDGVSGQFAVGAFAGTEANFEVSGELGESIDLSAGVDLKAGIGVEVSGEVEFSVDTIGIDAELGATIGIGIDANVDVSISPIGIYNDIGDAYREYRNVRNR